MKRIALLGLMLFAALGISSHALAQAGGQSSLWQKIEPGGDTVCAHGTPYAFWTHEGISNNLLVYFEGGGGCWNADTCRDTGAEFNGFYDSRIGSADAPYLRGGMLDLSRAENPFHDYSIVYVPSCTGDVHWGDNVYTYEDAEEGDVTIHFNGFVNAQAALAWAYQHIPAPESVFVSGCSAGSVGSIVHAPYIIEHYAGINAAIPVYQLGDSLSLLFTRPVNLQTDWHAHDNFPQWIPELASMQPLDWTMAKYYQAIASYYPDDTFSQFNSIQDSVQVFYTFPDDDGDGADWENLLEAHLAIITAPNYHALTAGGTLHCLTPRPQFYTYAIDGVPVRDWVEDLASGRAVESLHCRNCELVDLVD
ncbi:MAG: pectin acetylesterase-family hydrolase [Chloroflexota bacterium]